MARSMGIDTAMEPMQIIKVQNKDSRDPKDRDTHPRDPGLPPLNPSRDPRSATFNALSWSGMKGLIRGTMLISC